MKKLLPLAIAFTATTAAAQDGPTVLPKIDPAIWQVKTNEGGASLVHKPSGAVCPTKFRDLKLVAVKDYIKDGTNSACQFEKGAGANLTRLTLYVYTYKNASGVAEYRGAKNAIMEYSKNAAVTITEQKEEAKKCHQSFVPIVAGAILKRNKKDNPDQKDGRLQLGVAMYHYKFTDTANTVVQAAGTSGRAETSLLSVYKTGKWIVKARINLPAGETSRIDGCRYIAFANLDQARVIRRN